MSLQVTTAQVGRRAAKYVPPGSFDIRVNGGEALSEILQRKVSTTFRAAQVRLDTVSMGISKLRSTMPNADVRFSTLTGSAEVVENRSGALTSVAPDRDGKTVIADFLREHFEVFGLRTDEVEDLRFIAESKNPEDGLRMVRFEQVVNGIPIFQSETRAILDRDGQLVRTIGLLVPDSHQAEPLVDLIQPNEALVSAMRTVGIELDAASMEMSDVEPDDSPRINLGHQTRANSVISDRKTRVNVNNRQIRDDVPSKLVYFPVAPGIIVPAWSQVTFTRGAQDWYTLVDARTGALLWRKNIRDDASTQEARFRVYVQADGKTPADSPAPHSPTTNTLGLGTQYAEIAPTIVNMLTAQNITASPNGWISDGGTTTTGNNVDAYLDRVSGAGETNVPDIGALDNNGRPVGNPDANTNNRDFLGTSPRDFQTTYLPPPQAGNPESGQTATGAPSAALDTFRRAVVAQLFYTANFYHDRLFNLGFNEAAGNFQTTNFSGMGVGNDPVKAEAQDASSTNNANFSTPPDGTSGRMQMFRFTDPTIDRDGDLDAEVVMHELTHGTSNRLIGNGNGLIWDVARGMGEGWSDFYAMSILNNTNSDNPNGLYATGAYATYKLAGLLDNYVYGIRRFPYTTDNTVNPLTWADVDGVTANNSGGIPISPIFGAGNEFEVHNIGEIWCLSLWEVRSRIIADPAGANGDVPTGNNTTLQLITNGMKMTPINPSFVDARDAIIAADVATNASANEESIWGGFADRGLGYKAIAPLGSVGFGGLRAHMGIGESFDVPYLDPTVIDVDDSVGGNNNGALDPGEPVKLNIKLFNPWHKASKGVASATGTLTSSTSGVNIVTGNATYGAIAPQATVAPNAPFAILLDPSLTAGQTINFSISVNSSLGTRAVNFTLRVGKRNGTDSPITYTRTVPGGLAIPDANSVGVTDTFTISDDKEIADLNFRVDSLTHTYTGDLSVMLKAPNGYGVDLIFYRGVFFGASFADGNNFTNVVIDDQVAGDTAHDLNQQSAAAAPFTGAYRPAFNSAIWPLFGVTNLIPDPVGQLSRLNGQSTKGDWKLHITDRAVPDTGALNVWSLIVTPTHFDVTGVAPTITCPAGPITVNAAQGQCSASVPFTVTATGGPAPTVTCKVGNTVVTSGSTFPVGSSTVNCTASNGVPPDAMCSFVVNVIDNQPPVFTNGCPANVTTVAIANCPISTTATANFATPTATDNCSVTVACNPPSGSPFPIGTTTVTCTATDPSNNTAQCSFSITVFNGRLQDDSNPNNVVLFNTATGAYSFCCGGTAVTGTGTVTLRGCVVSIQHNTADRRVLISADFSAKRGTASYQSFTGGSTCTISDRNTADDTRTCP